MPLARHRSLSGRTTKPRRSGAAFTVRARHGVIGARPIGRETVPRVPRLGPVGYSTRLPPVRATVRVPALEQVLLKVEWPLKVIDQANSWVQTAPPVEAPPDQVTGSCGKSTAPVMFCVEPPP